MPPTVFMGHRADEGPWTSRDRELSKALHLHEASLCDGCHQPLDESLDPDREGWYIVDVHTCAGCRARDIELRGEAEPGTLVSVRADPGYVKRS